LGIDINIIVSVVWRQKQYIPSQRCYWANSLSVVINQKTTIQSRVTWKTGTKIKLAPQLVPWGPFPLLDWEEIEKFWRRNTAMEILKHSTSLLRFHITHFYKEHVKMEIQF